MTIPAELALRTFILDYLNKRGLNSAAEALRVDHMQKEEQALSCPPPVESPNGFLFDFFGMFWDVFSARLNARVEKSRIRQRQEQQQHPPPHQQQSMPPQQQHQQQLHQSSQQNQLHRQQHQTPHPQSHPQQHPQHPHPHQHPQHAQQNHQPQHAQAQASAAAPQPSGQQPGPAQTPNAQQALNPNISVDASLPVAGAGPAMQTPGPMPTANIAQNPNIFVNQHHQRSQAHASQAMLNPHAFRNAVQNMPNPQSQLQSQQLRHHKLQQHHAMMQSSHRQQPVTSGSAQRMRVSSGDNRRTLQQSQLAAQSLSLESSLQGQKATIPSDQAAAALSSDALDVNGALDPVFSTVGTRGPPPRSSGAGVAAAAAAAAAVSRSMMPQMAVRTHSAQLPSGSTGAPIRGGSAKSRQFGLPAGSDAPSSASRRGALDITVNAGQQFDVSAVEDESQPRTGGGGNSSGQKKRSASQNISRKSPGSSRTDALSPRGFGASDGGGPAKRQRGAGLYAPPGTDASMIQQIQQHQKQLSSVDMEHISRGLGQAHGTPRAQAAQLIAIQQRQQAFQQGAEQMTNAQFLSQIGPGDKGSSGRNVGRYVSRQGTVANPSFAAQEHGMNNRQREAYIQPQLSAGRRTPAGGISERENNGSVDGRGSTRGQKGAEGNFSAAQTADQAGIATGGLPLNIPDNNMPMSMSSNFFYLLERQMNFNPNVAKMSIPTNTGAFPGLTANLNAAKKVGQNGSSDGNIKDNGRDDQVGVVGDVTKQHNDAQMSAQIQRDPHMPLDTGSLKDDAGSMHLRQAFSGNDLLKSSSAMQITEQDMGIVKEKKGKSEVNGASSTKQNASRSEIRRSGSSRALKTVETASVSGAMSRPDSAGKASGLNGTAGTMAQTALGTIATGSKREKAAGDLEAESRSTKSDRQGSGTRGGGTPSQKSTASGGSGAVDARGTQGTSSTTKRGRARSRGRGSGSRRSRGDRAPPRGSAAGRSGSSVQQQPRTSALEQNVSVSGGMSMGNEAGRGPQNDVDERIPTSSIIARSRGNVQNVEARGQSQKAERNRLAHAKPSDGQADLGSVAKLGFDNEESGANDSRGQGQQAGSQLHSDGGPLLEMLPQTGNVGAGRGGDEAGLDPVEKEFTMQQLGLVAGNGSGKLGGHGGSNYNYDIQYLAEDETDIRNMLHTMQGNLALDAGTDFEDDNILGVTDPADLSMTGRNRA